MYNPIYNTNCMRDTSINAVIVYLMLLIKIDTILYSCSVLLTKQNAILTSEFRFMGSRNWLLDSLSEH